MFIDCVVTKRHNLHLSVKYIFRGLIWVPLINLHIYPWFMSEMVSSLPDVVWRHLGPAQIVMDGRPLTIV